MARYEKPGSLDDALRIAAGGGWMPLAGGTDFFPLHAERPVTADLLDLSGLSDLKGIRETATHWAIGAGTTWAAIRSDKDLPPAFDALKAAAAEVGSVQIQNRATLGGNLCNASPAADGVPALLILDAEVELRSQQSARRLPLGEFIQGNRRTARAEDELLTAILLPKAATAGSSAFVKLGARRYLVISIAMAAARLALGPGRTVARAAVAVGACSPAAQRLPLLEAVLAGRSIDAGFADAVRPEHLSPLAPIGDVRADAAYRIEAAAEIVRRTLAAAAAAPPERAAA